jgi:uncharacterized protein (TIGR03083 family)
MTSVNAPDPLEELRYALAEADAEPTPAALRGRVMLAALAGRVAGRTVHQAPAITAVEGFRRTTDALARLLDTFGPDDWRAPALRDLDVQGLLGHLIGVERHFVEALDADPGHSVDVDHITGTNPVAWAQAGRAPAATLADWRAAVAESLTRVSGADAEMLHATVSLHGIALPLRSLLVVRAFEVWTHDDDMRRATGRPVAPPDRSALQLMTDLAVILLPAGMAKADLTTGSGHTARIVLTGQGGGTWQKHLAWGDAGATDVRIVADAVAFCRLVANRLTPDELAADITGDAGLGHDVLLGAAALAFD